ncbi:hypothetical protein BGZ94_000701 [Podila epigama]|nr:hypothetical protein BGZ94_000701 [Podila epigama]
MSPGATEKQTASHALSFSNHTSLQVSLHHVIEFLVFLTKAMERYLLSSDNSGVTGQQGTSRRSSVTSPTLQTSATGASASGTRRSSTTKQTVPGLSAALIQLNSAIVYEILDECLEQGFPMAPSLSQLDLLVFGNPKHL